MSNEYFSVKTENLILEIESMMASTQEEEIMNYLERAKLAYMKAQFEMSQAFELIEGRPKQPTLPGLYDNTSNPES